VDIQRIVVSESSGCLDEVHKYALSRSHFDMNKFGKATEQAFETLSGELEDMIEASPQLLVARSEGSCEL
jgi:hypothetical protein